MVEVKDRAAQAASGAQPMTGGQALVASLLRQGIDTIFGLPGVQLDGAFDALYDAQQRGDVRVIHPRHEQTTAYMADGYARTTGRIGTCLVVPGPGLLNATAALSTAYACNAPVLAVTGQIQSDLIGVGRDAPRDPEPARNGPPVAKHAERAVEPMQFPVSSTAPFVPCGTAALALSRSRFRRTPLRRSRDRAAARRAGS